MRTHKRQVIQVDALFALAMSFLFSSQIGFSQAIDHSSFSKMEQKRLDSISYDWDQCDRISAEGNRLECTKQSLAAFELEILRVNAEVRKSLPEAQQKEFDNLCRSWKRYFDAEKKHWLQTGKNVGTVRWIGSHNSLVQIAKSRVEFLLGQLP
jgi:hypothetical protein